MNRVIIVVLLASFMMGCSTVYKSGQTPDDVYFSPAMNNSSYVVLEEKDEYRSENVPMNDRYLRMKSLGRSRWSAFDEDYAYWNDPHWNNRNYFNSYSNNNFYAYGNRMYGNSYFSNPFNNMYYGQPYILYNANSVAYKVKSSGPRVVNLNNYTPVRVSNYDPKTMNVSSGSSSNNRTNTSSGTPRGGYNPVLNGESNSNPSRTFSNNSSGSSSPRSSSSSSNSSSSSSPSSSTPSSSGSAPVRTFPKGGGN